MVRNSEKLDLATQYRKRGFSYSEIAKICGVSKSTVSNWFAKKAFSKKVKEDNVIKAARENVKRIALVNKARASERLKQYKEVQKNAVVEFKHYKSTPLFIAGLMLYVASGDQTHTSRIRLTSKNSIEHKLFIKFITAYFSLAKTDIKIWLLLGENAAESIALAHWSSATGLPKSQFGKTQFLSRNKKTPLHNGTGNTIIANTVLKRKLMCWLELATKELQK